MGADSRRYKVRITREVIIYAPHSEAAAERALNLVSRQKAWPEDLSIEASYAPEPESGDDP